MLGNFIISKANSARTSLFQLSNLMILLLTYLFVLLSIFLKKSGHIAVINALTSLSISLSVIIFDLIA